MKIVAVIPAFNEGEKIKDVIVRLNKYVDRVIVVDDGSTDSTTEIVKSIDQNIIILRHIVNLGKGASLKTGCEKALKEGADILIMMDADGQHEPEDIPKFIDKIVKYDFDIIFGARRINKNMPLMMLLGNRFLTFATLLLFGINIKDTQSGFKVFKAKILPQIIWQSNRYSADTEIVINTAKAELKFEQIEIETIYSDKHKGTTVFDGIRIFFNLLIWKFS